MGRTAKDRHDIENFREDAEGFAKARHSLLYFDDHAEVDEQDINSRIFPKYYKANYSEKRMSKNIRRMRQTGDRNEFSDEGTSTRIQ